MLRRWSLPASLVAALLVVGCAEPPNKEMDQAQGAIDAARAAGAEQYAREEYTAAVDALKRAHDAVGQSDYRLALNNALDSRERAQNAARQAADGKAQTRAEVERAHAEVTNLLTVVRARIEVARKTRAPRHVVTAATQELASIEADVQKAGEAMKAGDYLTVRPLLRDIRGRINKTITGLDEATTQQSPRRRR
jgi:Domain of unknown function (DUF4398)